MEVQLILPSWDLSALDGIKSGGLRLERVVVIPIGDELVDIGPLDDDCEVICAPEEVRQFLLSHEIVEVPVTLSCSTNEDGEEKKKILTVVPDVESKEEGKKDESMDYMNEGMEAFDSFDLKLAATMFTKASKKDSTLTAPLFNLASLCHMMNYPTLATHYFEQVLARDREDMTSWKSLWNLAQAEDIHVRNCCIEAYRTLASAYNDPTAKQKLAALTGKGIETRRMDTQYARAIYEDFGDAFESRLVDILGYRGPWILHDMLLFSISENKRDSLTVSYLSDSGTFPLTEAVPSVAVAPVSTEMVPSSAAWRILDLGCGSGLVAKAFGDLLGGTVQPPPPLTGSEQEVAEDRLGDPPELEGDKATMYSCALGDVAPLQQAVASLCSSSSAENADGGKAIIVGVDISSKMVEITARTACYNYLATCDMLVALQAFAGAAALDMVVAADTFIYVGELGRVFAAAAAALAPSGFFSFSVEDLERSSMKTALALVNKDEGDRNVDMEAMAAAEGQKEARRSVCKGGVSHVLVDHEVVGAVPGWGAQLLSSTRFAHSARYVELLATAHGFQIGSCRSAVLRTEGSVPVYGLFFLLQLQQ